jgi:hypothetical protein
MTSVTTFKTRSIWSARYWVPVFAVAYVAAMGAAFVSASTTGATDRVGSTTASASAGTSSSRANHSAWSHDSPPR